MATNKQWKWNSLALAAVSLAVLAGCSQDAKQDPSNAQKAKDPKQLEIAAKEKQISELKKAMSTEVAKAEAAKKRLPRILAESDAALRMAQSFRQTGAKQKNAERKTEILTRANKAQKFADEKSMEVLTVRREIYGSLNKARLLKKQLDTAIAQKEGAEKIAKAEASQVEKLKQTSGKQVASQEKKQM